MTPRKNLRKSLRAASGSQPFQIEACEQRMLLSGATPEYASIDGSGNNLTNVDWGSVGEQLGRLAAVEYGDGISSLGGELRASAREVSNAVASQSDSVTNDRYLTDYLWIWGQFLDHDIDLTDPNPETEEANIAVPTGDPWFDPYGTGTQEIALSRSEYDHETGTDVNNPRQQVNVITAFIDGSVIYGSDDVRAAALRTFSDGKLKTSAGDLLPYNEDGLPNAGGTSAALFLAGDIRANENIALTSMHTIWVREHNRIAEQICSRDASLTDEEIYQQARIIVSAQLQHITYNEFLPALLGNGAIGAYEGYDSTVNPNIANEFSTAAYRLGHTFLSPELQRQNADGSDAAEGDIALRDAFFRPGEIEDHGIDSVLQGAASQLAQEFDTQIIDEVRNFLFGPPGSGGFDLASLNIQRGRDHGLADYNQAREDMGLARVTSFDEISSNPNVVARLQSVYDSVDEIDLWVGMLAEDHVQGASVGELVRAVLVDQFTRLRDGDRFWYENRLGGEALFKVRQTSLADVIERNSNVVIRQDNIFFAESVMEYRVPGNRPDQVTRVQIRGGNVQIVDQLSGVVMMSRPVGEVDQVRIIGRDNVNDRMVIEGGMHLNAIPGGIVLWGGHDGDDVVHVAGTPKADDIDIEPGMVYVNGHRVENGGFEVISIAGGSGNDDIRATGQDLKGNMVVYGNMGDDLIVGCIGNDLLIGGAGNDVINGSRGNDVIEGNQGNDRLFGASGIDFIRGGEGHDQIYGGDDDDFLFGEEGNDALRGERGNDMLVGGPGRDSLIGGPGQDTIVDADLQAAPDMMAQPPRRDEPTMMDLARRVLNTPDDQGSGGSQQSDSDKPSDFANRVPEPSREIEDLGVAALENLFRLGSGGRS